MVTLLLDGNNLRDIARAGEILRSGGLVGIPTETVYGLAANALNSAAVRRIFEAKGRPSDNPLIVHIAELSQWAPLVRELPKAALRLAETFWPGPLTVILPKSDLVPDETSGGLDTVAVRFPSHPAAQAVIRAAGVPLAAPSANLSGRPSPTGFAHLREDMEGRVEALLDGGDCGVGLESTVVTLAETPPRLLRPGGITLTQLRFVLGEVRVDPAVLHQLEEGEKASSPGMKYRHYAPRASLALVDASPDTFINYVNQFSADRSVCALCFEEEASELRVPFLSLGSRYDGPEQARRLFFSLHRLDELGAEKVYAHMPSKNGVGLAVYNRLIRAAGFSVICPSEHRLLGLTGPSGAGKSTVGRLLEQSGWAVVDCDALTRSPQVYDAACLAELRAAFGVDVVKDGALDRRRVAELALATPEGKALLESITFPRILKAMWEQVDAARSRRCKVVALDAPTLFEAGLDRFCDRILVVTAPREQRLARIMSRDGVSAAQAEARLSAQHGEEFFLARADYVVENGDGTDLVSQLAPILADLGGDGP